VPVWPHIVWLPEILSLWLKEAQFWGNRSSPRTAEVKVASGYNSASSRGFMAWEVGKLYLSA
jgi:hypothetical protein